jgi:hypothetical protein
MSVLQQSLEKRRATETSEFACVTISAPTPAVVIASWSGESWVLPWAHFVAARYNSSNEEETLELSFAGHTVVASGRNFRRILDDLASFRIGWLRDLPTEYEAQGRDEETYIGRITVTSLPNSRDPSSKTSE